MISTSVPTTTPYEDILRVTRITAVSTRTKMTIFLVMLFAFCFGPASASEKDQQTSAYRKMIQDVPIYVASSDFDITVEVPGEHKSLTAKQLYKFESVSSKFFSQLILQKIDVNEEEILFTNVNAKDLVKIAPSKTMLRSTIVFTYAGESMIPSFSSLLTEAFDEMELGYLTEHMQDKGIIEEESKIEKVTFSEGDEDKHVYYVIAPDNEVTFEENEHKDFTGLIIGLSIALLISFLCIVYLCMVAGLCTCFRSESKKTKSKHVSRGADDADLKVSRTLGAEARNTREEDGVFSPDSRTTPRKRLHNYGGSDASSINEQDEMYPLSPSESTFASNATDHSLTTRAPLGIASMKKLKNYLTPSKNNKSHVPFDVSEYSSA